MVTVAGEMLTLVESLARFTVTPPVGAAEGRVTWNAADCPKFSDTPAGRMSDPAVCTETLAVVFVTLGEPELAVMVVLPTPVPTAVICTLVAPLAKVTVAGTVAIPVGLALRLTVRPDEGAGADRFRVRVAVVGPVIE
jgi:hypothetical protein